MKIQLKRSNVVEGSPAAAKEPTAAQMEYGELAVNYSNQDPAIFLKDSNDQIIRIGGLGAIGYDFLGGEGIDVDISGKDVTFSVDLAGGDDGLEFVGSALDKLSASIASDSVLGSVKIGDNLDIQTDGVLSGKIPVIISDTTPPVEEGYLWFNSSSGQSFVGYVDPNGDAYWVGLAPAGPQGEQGIQGPQGDKGDTGDPGTTDPADILYTFPTGVEQTLQNRLEQYVTPEDFGAIADYREIPGATVYTTGLSGSAKPGIVEFPLNNGNFTNDDLGKYLNCYFVDNSGNMYPRGEITQIINANEIEVTWIDNVASTATSVSVAVGTDNEDAFQLLMQYCYANPGTKVQLNGKYGIGKGTDDTIVGPTGSPGRLDLPSHTTFYGTGRENSGLFKVLSVGVGWNVGSGIVNGIWENREYYTPSSGINEGDYFIDFSGSTADYAALKTAFFDVTKNKTSEDIIGVRSQECNLSSGAGGRYPMGGSLVKVVSWDDDNHRIYLERPLGFDIPNPLVFTQNDWNDDPGSIDYFTERVEIYNLTLGRGFEGTSLNCNGSYGLICDNVRFESVARYNTNCVCYGRYSNIENITRTGGPEWKVFSNNLTIKNWTLRAQDAALPATGQQTKTNKVLLGQLGIIRFEENLTITNGGSGYTDGTYSYVKLTSGTGTGALATVEVSAGVVTSVQATYGGLDYVDGDILGLDLPTSGTQATIEIPSGSTFDDPLESCINLGEGLQNVYVDGYHVQFDGLWVKGIGGMDSGNRNVIMKNMFIKAKGIENPLQMLLFQRSNIVDLDQNPIPDDNYYKQTQKQTMYYDNIQIDNEYQKGAIMTFNNPGRNDPAGTNTYRPVGHFSINNFRSNLNPIYIGGAQGPVFINMYGPNQTITSASITNCEGKGILFAGAGPSGDLDTCDFSDVLFNNITCDGPSRSDLSNTGAGSGRTFQMAVKNITRIDEGALRQVQVNAATQRPQDRYLITNGGAGSFSSIIGPVAFPVFDYLRGLDSIKTKGTIYYDRGLTPNIDLKFTVSSSTLPTDIVASIPQFALNQYEMFVFDSDFAIDQGSQGYYGLLRIKIVNSNGSVNFYEASEAFDIGADRYTRDITVNVEAAVDQDNITLLDFSCMPELYASG